MDENTKKTIKEKFDSLPESIQEIILSSDYQNTLVEIGKSNQLTIPQMGTLELETTLVMMGLTPTKNFEAELTKELGVNPMKGSQIVNEINTKIFLRIRDLLKLMNTPKGEEPSLEETSNLKGVENIPFKVFTPVVNTINPIKSTPPQPSPYKEEGVSIQDNSVLNHAGIEIVNPVLIRNAVPSDAGGETRNEMLKDVEQPSLIGKIPPAVKEEKIFPSSLVSKLSETVKMPGSTTEYSMSNLTKNSGQIPLAATPKLPKVDPYRMSPDE